jgi:hypothetical protein
MSDTRRMIDELVQQVGDEAERAMRKALNKAGTRLKQEAKREAPRDPAAMTLGEFIDELEKLPGEAEIAFEFGDLVPGRFHSWRMVYSQLCLDWDGRWPLKVSQLLAEAKACVGKTFEGWKGGDFVMGRDTNLWIARAGESGGYTRVMELRLEDDEVKIITKSGLEDLS